MGARESPTLPSALPLGGLKNFPICLLKHKKRVFDVTKTYKTNLDAQAQLPMAVLVQLQGFIGSLAIRKPCRMPETLVAALIAKNGGGHRCKCVPSILRACTLPLFFLLRAACLDITQCVFVEVRD